MTTHWQNVTVDETLARLETSWKGLDGGVAGRRLDQYGENKLAEGKKRSMLAIFFAQFGDFMIWVLIAAALVSGFLSEWVDAAIIGVVVLLNAVMGTVQEAKAEAALDALKAMSAPFAKVVREGKTLRIPASQVAVGDVVVLEAGDAVPADLRLIETGSLKIEESALTGESAPAEKDAAAVLPEDAPLGDRINLAYMGTSVTYGRALGVAVGTGMHTEMGKIAGQLSESKQEVTPLQRKLNQLSNVLSYAVIAIAALIFGVNLLRSVPAAESFLSAVSLAVAAIPEGMVAVVTVVLAMGMQRMAGQGAIIRRLPAVETLGSTDVICSDKTGTLTVNRMTVREVWTGAADAFALAQVMLHCNDSSLGEGDTFVGDPTETALLAYLLHESLATRQDIAQRRRVGEIPFESERKLSTVVIDYQGRQRVLVKGAPDVLLRRCTQTVTVTGQAAAFDDKEEALTANEEMASHALRVLAFAYKDVDKADCNDPETTENGLTFCGLVGMIDPPREEAKAAVAQCRQAGILPVMITGDHVTTASAIARELGILDEKRRAVTGAELEKMTDDQLYEEAPNIAVYARVSPEHKSRIVRAWQRRGKVVSMTGDGVNDAPALKAADIGVGMGITGTDVSKGAADMVLTDDNFATIVVAVKEGRRIFDNIHKAVRFLLSCNCGEVIVMFIAALAGWKVLGPTHILWANLVTDSVPALALGVEPTEPDVMDRNPRGRDTPFFSGRQWVRIAVVGAVEAVLTLAAYWLGRTTSQELGMTMAFTTLTLAQLFAALGFQSEHLSLAHIRFKEHPWLWRGLGVSLLLQLVVLFVPPLRAAFGLVLPSGVNWLEIGGLCLVMLAVTELQKWAARRRNEA